MSDAIGFGAFAGQQYLNLETYKKDGQGVKTPVWFAADHSVTLDLSEARLYAYTIGVSGKVKRIRNSPQVRIAPCDMRGNVKGEWVSARAAIVTGTEAQRGTQLLKKKYWPWRQLLDFFAMFRKRERTVFLIRPA